MPTQRSTVTVLVALSSLAIGASVSAGPMSRHARPVLALSGPDRWLPPTSERPFEPLEREAVIVPDSEGFRINSLGAGDSLGQRIKINAVRIAQQKRMPDDLSRVNLADSGG